MNGKGPLTPTEQALMRLHNYGCSTRGWVKPCLQYTTLSMVSHTLVHGGFATELFGEKIMCGRAAHNLLTTTLGVGPSHKGM
jgi:hypothetical protein